MTEIFIRLVNMSISASWLVLAVLLIRLFLKKTPKWITCILWGLVALRLLIPFYMESNFSLIPSPELIPQDIMTSEAPAIHSGISAVDSAVNPALTQQVIREEPNLTAILSAGAILWAIGASAMLIYSLISFLRLRWQVKASIVLREPVYICDDVDSPFVLGFFRPRIYIPSGMARDQLDYVLAHENAHIRRRDYWWKPIGFCLLAVYWFNPLLWLAYILLCRDIEMACDEKVIADMDSAQRKGYSQALVACSVHRRMIMACPVAFGEVSVKSRIKGVFHYKKPTLWIVIASVALCGVVAVCFLTNPKACLHDYHSQVVIASTCTQKGMENRTCQKCSHSYTVPVDICAHTYDQGVVLQAPTCIAQGTKELTCTGCGAKKTEPMEIIAHIDGEYVVTAEPNCSQEGQVSTTCTYCKTSYVVETLPVNDVHDLQEKVVKEPTCTEKGEGIKECSQCDYSEGISYAPVKHDLYISDSAEGTCRTKGYRHWQCTQCSFAYVEDLGMGAHNWKTTAYVKECTCCGMVVRTDNYFSRWNRDTSTPPDFFPVIIWDSASEIRPTP